MAKKYTQKYLVETGDNSNYVAITWMAGLYDFKIYHNETLVSSVASFKELAKGVELFSPELGNLYIKVLQKPLGFEVKLGDRYLEGSRIIAEEKLRAISSIFYVVGGLTLLTSFRIHFSENILLSIVNSLPTFVAIFYLFAGWKIRKGFIWPYIVGGVLFIAFTVLMILALGWPGIPSHVLRILFSGLILSHVKYIITLYKHRIAVKEMNPLSSADILDN
ncbi:MAG: hypothetical protein N4A35_07685 [Flavobacteriales bacterium]|jgi:hypothetical protein|nr:hypothetical protein [Flavobacteriales bacterium]